MNKQSLPKIIIKNEIHKFSNAKDFLKFIKNMDKITLYFQLILN